MQNVLLPYYNQELAALRQLAREFALQFPKVAGRLLLEDGIAEDPHVERLLEAFALLAARIHHKLDDEFSAVTHALFGILFPHYLAPIPSMSIVQFKIDPAKMSMSNKLILPKHTQLLSRRVQDMPCRFRTAYPVELWPLTVAKAKFDSLSHAYFSARQHNNIVATLQIDLQAHPGQYLEKLGINRVRFFLQGEPIVTHTLYELLFNHVAKIDLVFGSTLFSLGKEAIQAVGFERDEGLLDYDARSPFALGLLHEYFVFPEKFMFFDLIGLDKFSFPEQTQNISIQIHIHQFERAERLTNLISSINADVFRLGCTPIINLFKQSTEPLQVNYRKTEYQVIPDIRRPWGAEIYQINSVRKLVKNQDKAETIEYQPLYGLSHADDATAQKRFWFSVRKPSARHDDNGSDIYISLTDVDFDPRIAVADTLSIEATCTNRDLPNLLPFGGEQSDFEIENGSPVSQIRCLRKPTQTLRPLIGQQALWQLVSHLSLNYLSIIDDAGYGTQALRELLNLYNFTESAVMKKQIAGITHITSKPTMAKLITCGQVAFVQGIEIKLEVDETQFDDSGVFLFATLLERFFGVYAPINSFTQLTVTSRQRENSIKTWPARVGCGAVL